MVKFSCRDYGFDCDFFAEGDDAVKVTEVTVRNRYKGLKKAVGL